MKIKSVLVAAAVAAGLVASSFASAAAYTFDGSNTVSSRITFLGGPTRVIAFPNFGPFDFTINASSDGSLNALAGNLNGAGFSVGTTITTISTPFGPLQVAPVTGTGIFSIFDGVKTLTADVTFDTVSSFTTTVGLGFSTGINLSNIVYTGTNVGLIAVASSIDPTLTIAATFTPGLSLTQLMKKGAEHSTSYAIAFSGQPVPEPSTMALLTVGLGMVGFSLARARRR